MKTKYLEMGLMEIQAETKAESQAICGIIEMNSRWMPAAVVNHLGCRKVGQGHFNYCLVPDGSLNGTCRKKHPQGDGCDCLQDGIKANIKLWKQLPWNYRFKSAPKSRKRP